tara:strand:+ start:177 stop:626 length:450 start_codon:yes stop_codon:yes gene_type:complete
MILDERSEFCDATALDTAGTGRDLVGDVMDLGATPRDVGAGQPIYVVIQVDTAVTSGGSATVDFEICSDAQAAIAADGTATVHASTGAIAKATLVAGYDTIIALPVGNTYERFLGIVANVGTAALTAGKINAFLTTEHKAHRNYPDASN